MSDELTAIRSKFEALLTDLSRSCIDLRSKMSDVDSFKVEVAETKDDINLLESKITKTFVTLPDGKALYTWEYEALEKFAKSNRLDFDRLLNDSVKIINGGVVEVYLHKMSVQDISSLSKLTGLTKLLLHCNNIQDISVLSGLIRVRELCLYGNQIEDIDALSGLIGLKHLSLYYTKIPDIDALSGLTRLRELRLDINKIQDKKAAKKIIMCLKGRGAAVYEYE